MARALDQTKRSTILKAARIILLRDGYVAAKMTDIAAEAGVAPGTLYLYFANKESLAGALGEELLDRLSSQFLKHLKKLDTPEGIYAMLDWAHKIGKQERDVFAMMKQSKPNAKAPPQVHDKFVTVLSENLQNLMECGSIRTYDDPTNLAQIVLAIMHRVIMSCALYEDSVPEQITASAAAVLEHALFDDVTLKKFKDAHT